MYEFENWEEDRGKEDLSEDEVGYVFGLQDAAEERVPPDEENAPTFRIQRRSVTHSEVGAKSPDYGKFISMCPTSTHLVLGTKFNYILRWDITDETSTVARLEPKAKVRLDKVFASGADVLAACIEGSNYYINFKSKKPKPLLLNAMKGLVVTCMASKGGKVVVGTRQGDIFEVDFASRKATKVFTITDNKNQPVPILDMEMETFPTDPNKYLICAATSNKLYEFVTLNNLESSFKRYHNITKGAYMTEICGNCLTSEIKFHSEHGSANTVVWITEVGIFMSTLRWGAQDIGVKVTSDSEPVVIPLKPLKITSMAISPITILAFGSSEGQQSEQHLMAINRLSQDIRTIANLGKESYGRALKLSHISSSSTKRSYGRNFLLTKDALLEIVIINEDKELSAIYLSRQEFDLAKKFAKDATQRQTILATEAQHLFNGQMFQEAAKKYAELTTNHDSRKYAELTNSLDPVENINVSLRIPTFEEIALKFVKHNAQEALLKFLITKLERTEGKQRLQRTILASWIVESMLEKMGREKTNNEERERTTATLDQFLKDYSDDLPPDSTIELISSHGQSKQLLHYAQCIDDSRFVVESHIQNREFNKAVEVLKQHPKPEDIYFFAPTLINRATKSFTELLMKVKNLDSKKLLPALQKCKQGDSGDSGFVIKYLEYLIVDNHNRQPAIHNLLASLYSQVDYNEDRLLKFIRRQENNPIFDLKFILRICHHENHHKSCCAIYKILGLHESAVKEALRANDVELAKKIARERDNRTSDKKLWLLIARHVIHLNNTNGALEIVRMSDLNIEDILPHLKDFVEMKDFKNDVLKSLENHNKQIERLKQDMVRYTKSADDLRSDIERHTRQPAKVTASNLCDLSDKPILGHKFLVFPCTHVFRVEELRKKLKEYRHVVDEKSLAAQCPLCGLVMIEETGNIFKDDE